jgi:hypothetical protein
MYPVIIEHALEINNVKTNNIPMNTSLISHKNGF